jgi:tetratricopeptide (TPR) repeat protein
MIVRRGWLVLWFACLGCQSLVALALEADAPSPGLPLWEQGQQAMREGQPERAIGFYEKSLAADPNFTHNHMSLAAAYLEAGDDEAACRHLEKYVASHPEHVLIRSHYAELLLRLHRCGEARRQFERFAADAQEQGGALARHLVHCHTRLMELAEQEDDLYGVYLHRGIGLYRLACERVGAGEPEGELPVEGLLCKAANELARAREERPREARPCWYLYAVWARLAQKQAALTWLRRAAEAAPFSDLTPAEQRGLVLACRREDDRPAR